MEINIKFFQNIFKTELMSVTKIWQQHSIISKEGSRSLYFMHICDVNVTPSTWCTHPVATSTLALKQPHCLYKIIKSSL